MAQVLSLADYRARKSFATQGMPGQQPHPPPGVHPNIRDGDIWSRDYSSLDGLLHGIVLVREILDYHLHYSEEWKYHLLCLLEYVYLGPGEGRSRRFSENATLLKSFLAEELHLANKRDLTLAMLLLELMDKGFPTLRHQEHDERGATPCMP